ncbi:MAG: 2-C-methyl-D-erythritol 2,4-cyclodiphosphate synthase [Candidatus Bipolaricaulia bacterium]
MRVGIGLDSHRFGDGGSLILGGVEIPEAPRLEAHSDGDVLLHALFNAISSALGERSIGHYHPDTDEARRGISSIVYMETVKRMLADHGYRIENFSIALEASRPRLEPYVEAMRSRVAEIFSIEPDQIGITATSGEGLTAVGRGEGIRALAIVNLTQA